MITILGTRVDPTSYKEATSLILSWASRGESRYVSITSVHGIMEAHDSRDFQKIINSADLVTPDGMPLVWGLRRRGYPDQERVYGPELTLQLIEASAKEKIPIGLYGGSPETLQRLIDVLKQRYPTLKIEYSYCPPFRTLTAEEDETVLREMIASGIRILLIGLGCPKQERWMAEHKGRIQAVMLGVGAAFDFIAGIKQQAPHWMQENGLEWLFRLLSEPHRLWRRYLYNNPRFLWLLFLETMGWYRNC
jgi:N-acetylglucosaminyldiphosphoundecaprenol N-acetyl-beta-D-mannosaminyltransferase